MKLGPLVRWRSASGCGGGGGVGFGFLLFKLLEDKVAATVRLQKVDVDIDEVR